MDFRVGFCLAFEGGFVGERAVHYVYSGLRGLTKLSSLKVVAQMRGGQHYPAQVHVARTWGLECIVSTDGSTGIEYVKLC